MSFSEWKNVQLQDIVSKLGDGLHGTPKYDENGDYYFINGNNLVDGKIVIKDSTKKVSEEEFKKYKKELNDRTILLGINGTIGNVALYNNEKCILGKSACYFNVVNSVDKHFIKYVITDKGFQSYINNTANGTTIKNVSLKSIREFEFNLPDLKTQQRIASILSSLDDAIELNQQMNKTLEEMAKAIFKEWFVDFNFPNAKGKFQETEIGKIPVGWKVYTFVDLIDTVSETYRFGKKEKIIFLNTGDILDGEFLHRNYSDIASMPGQAKKSIKKNDILFSEIRPANKRFAFVNFDAEEYVVSTKLMVLRSKGINPRLVYFLLTREEMLKQLQHLAESRSGTFPQITFSQLKDLKVALPQDETLDSFVKILEAYYNQAEQNIEENQSLSSLRDTLLPKLMKGEIEIREKERV